MLKLGFQELYPHYPAFIGHSSFLNSANMLNRISHSIASADYQEAAALLQTLVQKLNLPDNLPPAEKSGQYMGQSSRGYVQDCIAAAKAYPKVPSGMINIEEMDKDLELVNQLDGILTILQPLVKNVLNARQLAGQDLMSNSNQVRESFVNAAKHDGSLRQVSDNLRKRYQQATAAKDKPTDNQPTTL